MASLNKVMLIGNLTRDPEVKYTPKGTAVAQLGLAVNRVYTTPQGEKKEEVTFIDVELWERQAELAGQYLKKGRPVFIEGRLLLDSWDDKATGQKRTKLKVRGEIMQFLGGRDDAGGGEGGGGGGYSRGQAATANSGGGGDDEYDQRPAPKKPPYAGAGQAGPGAANKGKPKPAAPVDPDAEEDDIPF